MDRGRSVPFRTERGRSASRTTVFCGIMERMARGWNSKSVDEQIEAAEVGSSSPNGERLTQAQIEMLWKKEGLQRSRARVQRDLDNSRNPRYREMLSAALADLDEQISKLQ